MKLALITAVIVGLMIILVIAYSVGLMIYIQMPRKRTLSESEEGKRKNGEWGDFDSYPKEEFDIASFDGYKLHSFLLKNEGNDNSNGKYVVVTHGYSADRWNSIKYANIFYQLGYNVLIYDLRHHGANKPVYCSMGHKESKDLISVIRYLRERFGENTDIGIQGESLGAASSILALGMGEKISFCVADCPFGNLGILLEDIGHDDMHLPRWSSHLSSYACQVIHGFRFDRIIPENVFTEDMKTPILFMHGKADKFILPKHSINMYEKAKGFKKIYLVDDARHAECYRVDPVLYKQRVKEFLDEIS